MSKCGTFSVEHSSEEHHDCGMTGYSKTSHTQVLVCSCGWRRQMQEEFQDSLVPYSELRAVAIDHMLGLEFTTDERGRTRT